MIKLERQIRQSIIDSCRWMNASGLNQGTSGNISVRYKDAMLITPSGIPYDLMTPEMIAAMPLGRDDGRWEGPCKPSSEWQFHFDILTARPDVGSVVHTHSTYATALAIARREIPPCHYMVAAFGGSNVRCAGYARYGTKDLSRLAIEALRDRYGCLLANHGAITVGADLDKALWRAVELEALARQYHLALQIDSGPVLLSDAEISDALAGFATYGQQTPPKPLTPPHPPRRRAGSARAATRSRRQSDKSA